MINKGSFALLVLLALSGSALASGFTATVSSDAVTMADTVQLTISLERDGNAALESYRPPSMPDFEVLRAVDGAQQLSWTIVNGRQTVRMVDEHVYLLKPKKKGALVISPAIARLNGLEMKTKPITVRVSGIPRSAVGATPSGPTVEPIAAPQNMRANDDIHVEANTDKSRVYVGEQVNASWRLWAASDILRYRSLADPKTDNFWSEDITPQQRAWERQVVKGRDYQVMLLTQRALFPLKSGKLVVTPLKAEVTTMQGMFAPAASEATASNALEIDVRPLPSDGKPASFPSTNVGKFELKAEVDRKQVGAGDAVTLKLTVSGVGNVHGARVSKLYEKGDGPDGWRAYEPTVKETLERAQVVRGSKVITYLMTPLRGGKLVIPALELPYFDPATGHYEISRTSVIEIEVAGDPKGVQTSAAGTPGENVLSRQIRPIHARASLSMRVGELLFERPRLRVIVLLTPPAIWLLVLVVDSLRRRLAKDTPRSRRRRARANARRRLRIAEYNIKMQRPPAFFAECARALYEHLEFRLGSKVESYTLDELRLQLVQRGFGKETAEALCHELENCDFARFAPSASGPGEMRAALRRVRTLLGFIENERLEPSKEAA